MDNPDIFTLAETIARDHQTTLAALENRRRSHWLFILAASLALTAPGTMAVMVVAAHYLQLSMPVSSAALLAFALIFALTFEIMNESYKRKAKHELLYVIAKALKLNYRRGGFITLGDLYDHHALPPYAQSRSEEGFSRRENGIEYQFQDFRISAVARLHWYDYRSLSGTGGFYGIAIRIGLGRRLYGHTVLMPNFRANGFLKRMINEKFQRFEDINLVFSKFKKRYTILSTDQVEARYVFDPAMMERIMAMDELLRSNWLEISFRGREMVVIAGQVRNHFEVGHLLNPVNVLTIEKALLQLDRMKTAIRTLGLNPHTGLGA